MNSGSKGISKANSPAQRSGAQLPPLVLHHYWRSSASWRVRWALAVKGLTYESRSVNLLKGEQRDAAYMLLNPSGQVPCLIVGNESFAESMSIVEYLDEKVPTPALLPADPIERMRVRQASLMVVAGIQPLQNLAPQQYLSPDVAVRSRWAAHWIRVGLTAYENHIRKFAGTYSFGGQITLADICLVPQAYNALRYEVGFQDFPTVRRIYENCMADSICYQASPFGQPEGRDHKLP